MTFKAKLSKQGNGYCIYVPKNVRTELSMDIEYEWEVRTIPTDVYTGNNQKVITPQQVIRKKRLVFNPEKGINEWK